MEKCYNGSRLKLGVSKTLSFRSTFTIEYRDANKLEENKLAEQPKQKTDTSLVGKPVDKLSADDLDALALELSAKSSEVEARQKVLKEEAEQKQFAKIAKVAKEVAQALGWQRLPKLTLAPDIVGANYTVTYAITTTKTRGSVKRATPDSNGGKVTVNKIIVAHGDGLAYFRDKDGNKHESPRGLIMALKQPDGKPESDRCWDISGKGISWSDIVVKYHSEEVTLVFNDGTEKLVKDAVNELESARAEA